MAAGAPCGAPAGGSGLRAPPQADMAGLELASHRLGGAQRHQAGLLDGPAPATEVQGEAGRGGGLAGTGRHQDHHAADGAAEGSGGHGMDGEEHRPPTPHRSGRARAPQALASALARAEVDGAVLVWCSLLPWLRPVADSVVRVWWCSWGSSTPQRPFSPALGSGAGCEPVPEVPLEQRPVPATARSALVAWPCRSAGSAGAPGCTAAGGPGPQR